MTCILLGKQQAQSDVPEQGIALVDFLLVTGEENPAVFHEGGAE